MITNEQWHLTTRAAEAYERIVAGYILGPWAPVLVDAAQMSQGDLVLDVACGTGVVARMAAARVGVAGRVTGVDLNPGMIAVAGQLQQPPGAPIEWLVRDAPDLQLPAETYDVVLCQQGLQFFPDKLKALREMRRVLRPGGQLALSVWNSIGLYNSAVGQTLSELIDKETAQRFCASRTSPTSEEITRLTRAAGFSKIELRVARLDVHLPPLDQFTLDHLAATPIASVIAASDARVQRSIGASVCQRLEAYANNSGVTYPEETHILTAQNL